MFHTDVQHLLRGREGEPLGLGGEGGQRERRLPADALRLGVANDERLELVHGRVEGVAGERFVGDLRRQADPLGMGRREGEREERRREEEGKGPELLKSITLLSPPPKHTQPL